MEKIQLNEEIKQKVITNTKENKENNDFLRYSDDNSFQLYLEGLNLRDYYKNGLIKKREDLKNMTDVEYEEKLNEYMDSQLENALKIVVSKKVYGIKFMTPWQIEKKGRILNTFKEMKYDFIANLGVDLRQSTAFNVLRISGMLTGVCFIAAGLVGVSSGTFAEPDEELIAAGLRVAILGGIMSAPGILYAIKEAVRLDLIPMVEAKIGYKYLKKIGLAVNKTPIGGMDFSNRPEISEINEEIKRLL